MYTLVYGIYSDKNLTYIDYIIYNIFIVIQHIEISKYLHVSTNCVQYQGHHYLQLREGDSIDRYQFCSDLVLKWYS